MLLTKTRSRSKIERPPKPKKRRKPIARKSRFKTYADIFKSFERRRSSEEIQRFAEQARQNRLHQETGGERACAELLRDAGLVFERERIEYRRTAEGEIAGFILLDFYLPDFRLCLECDGSAHRGQEKYDHGRDTFLESIGISVLRFSNEDVLKRPQKVREIIREKMS